MLQRMEKQREVYVEQPVEMANYSAKYQSKNTNLYPRSDAMFGKKDARKCTHCNNTNHTRERCFQLIGYPDWFPEERRKPVSHQAYIVDDEEDDQTFYDNEKRSNSLGRNLADDGKRPTNSEMSSQQLTVLTQEVYKLMKGKEPIAKTPINYNQREDFTAFTGFSGNISYCKSKCILSNWITDSGATSHMSSQLNIFENLRILKK